MKNSKKYIALFFVAVVLCPLLVAVYFPIKEKFLQHHAFEKMETEALEVLTIHKDSLVWVKQGKEILYQQELFDVKNIIQIGDSIKMSGLKDTKEMELYAIRDRQHKAWGADNGLVQEQVQKIVWSNQIEIISFNFLIKESESLAFPFYESRLEAGINKPCFSPPWLS